jgi:hypothetical protein
MSVELTREFDCLLAGIKGSIKKLAVVLLNGFQEDAEKEDAVLQKTIEEAVKVWQETVLSMEHPSSDYENEEKTFSE